MTTVGYGDYFPKTDLGRVMGIIICFWGVFIVSVFVVTLTNMLAFDKNEERTYFFLYKLAIK
jgi:potassium intermediate/small conductance calcium-activated channel subfamily N protein 2